MYKEVESDVAALSRRIMLMEEEAKKSETNLAETVTKLAVCSKDADNILKGVKVVESKCLNNEATLEELDKNLRSTTKMASDNEQKLDELSRKLGVQEGELKRGIERAELAESNLKVQFNNILLLFLNAPNHLNLMPHPNLFHTGCPKKHGNSVTNSISSFQIIL